MADIIRTLEDSNGTQFSTIAGALKDGILTTNMLQDLAITANKLTDNTIQTENIVDGAVTTAKIVDGTIATADLAGSSVTTAKIADGAVNTGKITDGNVTTVKIADATVAKGKLGSMTGTENLTIATPGGSGTVTARRISLGNKLYMLTYCGKTNISVGGTADTNRQVSLTWATAFTNIYTALIHYSQDGALNSYAKYTSAGLGGADTYIYSNADGTNKLMASIIIVGTRAS